MKVSDIVPMFNNMVTNIKKEPCAIIFTREQWEDILQMLRYCEHKAARQQDRIIIKGFIYQIEATIYAVADDYDI